MFMFILYRRTFETERPKGASFQNFKCATVYIMKIEINR